MKRKIINPYAKNKKKQPINDNNNHKKKDDHSNSRSFQTTTTTTIGTSSSTSIPSFTTFSQAFASSTTNTNHDTTSVAASNNKKEEGETGNGRRSAALSSSIVLMQQQPHVLHISKRQRGNPMLRYLRNVPFAYVSDGKADYLLSPQRCALFLSLKYHNLYPTYIHKRIAELQTDYDLRLLLCLVDVQDNTKPLLLLNKIAVINNMTLILAWTEEEAARYLETFKALETKDASIIQKRETNDYMEQVHHVLCHSHNKVNKTDASQLLSQFGSIKQIMTASVEELSLCPGIGEKKVKRLWDTFHKPFHHKHPPPTKPNNNS